MSCGIGASKGGIEKAKFSASSLMKVISFSPLTGSSNILFFDVFCRGGCENTNPPSLTTSPVPNNVSCFCSKGESRREEKKKKPIRLKDSYVIVSIRSLFRIRVGLFPLSPHPVFTRSNRRMRYRVEQKVSNIGKACS